MKKQSLTTVLAIGGTCLSLTAHAWGPGVHAYVADQVNKKAGWKNVNEMYGGMAPDVINYMFSSPYLGMMYYGTHVNFEVLFDAARTSAERTLALGFVTHNGVYGADSTAHSSSLTLDPAKGYVIQKAEQLAAILEQPGSPWLQLELPHAVTIEVCHTMIESSIDLLITRENPGLALKMATAAAERSDVFPTLLARAYARPFSQYFGNDSNAAAEALIQAEAVFNAIISQQAYAFQQDAATALDLIAEQTALLAAGFLEQLGASLPPGVEVKPLAVQLISAGMQLCAADYAPEVQQTVRTVKANMVKDGYKMPQY